MPWQERLKIVLHKNAEIDNKFQIVHLLSNRQKIPAKAKFHIAIASKVLEYIKSSNSGTADICKPETRFKTETIVRSKIYAPYNPKPL